MEFDTKRALSEDFLVWYFYNCLKPLIKLWINEKGRELDGWEELIWKATRAKAKAKMQSASSRDMDQRCYCGNWLVHASLDKASNSKNSKTEESKPKAQKPKTPNSNHSLRPDLEENTETFDKVWKEKKKHCRREKRIKKYPILVSRPLELIQQTIPVGRSVFKRIWARSLVGTAIKRATTQTTD